MESEQTPAEDGPLQLRRCHQLLRITTGVILAAFVFIVIGSTISTGPVVQVGGKILYFVILLSILTSLAVWYYRTRLEKQLEGEDAVDGDNTSQG